MLGMTYEVCCSHVIVEYISLRKIGGLLDVTRPASGKSVIRTRTTRPRGPLSAVLRQTAAKTTTRPAGAGRYREQGQSHFLPALHFIRPIDTEIGVYLPHARRGARGGAAFGCISPGYTLPEEGLLPVLPSPLSSDGLLASDGLFILESANR